MNEMYFSIDVETDGPIPGQNSMLSLGAAAFTLEEGCLFSWSTNLKTLPGAEQDKDTMNWWKTQPDAWAACQEKQLDPQTVMRSFSEWVSTTAGALKKKPVCVAYPAGFDFMFVYWYLIKFTGNSPFSFSCLDIKSYVAGMCCKPYRKVSKKSMPKRWLSSHPHTHLAVDDAIEQGHLFMNMLKENLNEDQNRS